MTRPSDRVKSFKGRVILSGDLEGEALVTHTGFNSLACFYKSLLAGEKAAICSDRGNMELFGKNLTDRIICLPQGIGSTSAGATWHRAAQVGVLPKAMLFSKHIDSLTAAGLMLAEVWVGKRVVTIDQLGDEFLEYVKNGDKIAIQAGGIVTIC
jgi:predicted aconitase with swiveling domain